MSDHQNPVRLFRYIEQLQALGAINANRLFKEEMLVRFKNFQREWDVSEIRGGYEYRIHPGVNQFLLVVENTHAGNERERFLNISIVVGTNRHDVGMFGAPVMNGFHVAQAHGSHADKSNS